jgi:hypothetical protein
LLDVAGGGVAGRVGEGGTGTGKDFLAEKNDYYVSERTTTMRVIIEVQSYILMDVPDANTADDVCGVICGEVESTIHNTPEEGVIRHAHIETFGTVWGDKECTWLDTEGRKRAEELLDKGSEP